MFFFSSKCEEVSLATSIPDEPRLLQGNEQCITNTGKKEKKVINEIFTTEKSYQQHVQTLINVFLEELRKAHIIPTIAINTIFSNIEGIQAINRELLSHMETLGVGDAFLAMAPFIKLYSTYANNFEQASNTLQEWEKKSPEFAEFITRQEALGDCKGLTLRSLLITPVQRVPRYKLLLESLLNKTPRDYPDFSKLEEATEEIAKVAEHINDNIRQHENFQKMLSIQKSFTGEGAPKLLAPGRHFIKEGSLLKACRRGSQERMFFLFSDILIYAKKNGMSDRDQSTYSSQRVFSLNECELEQMFGSSLDSDGAADAGSMFKITCRDKSLFLYSKSKLEAASWFNAIKEAMGTLKTCRASLKKRVSRGESGIEKRKTPLHRSAVLKSKILRTPKGIDKKTLDFSCMSPASYIRDSLYPLRKELKKKKNSKESPAAVFETHHEDPCIDHDAMLSSSDEETDHSDVSQSENASYETTESHRDDADCDDADYIEDNEPQTPSGLIDSESNAMIDRQDTPSGSEYTTDSESEHVEQGVATRVKKRRITIDEKENQIHNFLSPLPSKRMCFLPKLLCGGVNRTPLSSSRK
ncbi:hypothetical protein QZH41_013216 [Actinostola sp. cb2023]|nr:hypothetical protein QZH41_013216 [Actinostola sp. cb2023]